MTKKVRFPIKTEVAARFVDCDPMGHVNNANYLTYFEQGRVAYFKKLENLDLTTMDAHSAFGFIIAEIAIQYHSPVQFDEVVVVSLRVAEIRTKAFRMEYEIREKKSNRLVATGHSIQVMYNYQKQKTFEIPDSLRKKIEAFEKNQ